MRQDGSFAFMREMLPMAEARRMFGETTPQ
jgi:hypothetical protein